MNKAKRIVRNMLEHDPFSRWLGVEIISIKPGAVNLKMKVRSEMLNGFGVAHGSIAFALADSALAFSANTHGRLSVALQNNISYPVKIEENDVLHTEVEELSLTKRTGTYDITVLNQRNEKVALFRGTVYRTTKIWD